MTQRATRRFGETLDASEVAALTGLNVDDFDPARPIQVVSTGTAFAIVPLRSAESLARLRVRQDEATAFLRARGARWFYVLGPEKTAARNGSRSRPTGVARACSSTAEKIRPLAPLPDAPSVTSCATAPSPPVRLSTCARESKSPAQAIYSSAPGLRKTPKFTRQIHPKAKSRMCASAEAQFLLFSKGGFSSLDAHAFNRYSTLSKHAANSGPNAKIRSQARIFPILFSPVVPHCTHPPMPLVSESVAEESSE